MRATAQDPNKAKPAIPAPAAGLPRARGGAARACDARPATTGTLILYTGLRAPTPIRSASGSRNPLEREHAVTLRTNSLV
jgi:hypothetical protein